MKCIYKITNVLNNKVYIGQTYRYKIRQKEHLNDLRTHRHSNKYLQEDFNKFGETNFKFEIIKFVDDNISDEQEDFYMDMYGGIDSEKIYNSMNSVTKSKFMKQKLSNKYKGKNHIELYGLEKAEQMRKKNSQKHLNKKATYIPYKGKVKCVDGSLKVVDEATYMQVHSLRNQGYKIKDIINISGIKYNGIHLILTDSLYLPFKCND